MVQTQDKIPVENRVCLRWAIPLNLSALHRWGASLEDYNALFSFWNKWALQPFPNKTPISNWYQVFLVFLQLAGVKSPFCSRCQHIGAALWKFRTLSISLLQEAWRDDFDIQELDLNTVEETHWCNKLPAARKFPEVLGIPLAWDLRRVCLDLVKKQTEIAAARQLQFKNNLFSVQDFLALVPEVLPVVRLDPISIAWVTHTRRKRLWLPWEITAVSMKNKSLLDSISEKPLQFWTGATALNIRKFFRPQSTAKRQLNCKLRFCRCCVEAIVQFMHNFGVCRAKTCHVVLPAWHDDMPVCHACCTAIPFAQKPERVFGRRPSPTPVSDVTFREHRCHIESMILEVQNIILKLES